MTSLCPIPKRCPHLRCVVRASLAPSLITLQPSLPASPSGVPKRLPDLTDLEAVRPVVRRDLLDHLPVADVPAEEGALRRPAPPSIRINFRGQDEFSLFRTSDAEPSAGLVVYTAESSKIYYDVLTGFFGRLRDIFSAVDKEVDPSELTLEIKELDIKINEVRRRAQLRIVAHSMTQDNVYAAQAELEDLHRLFRAYHDDAPFVVHIGLRVRFVLRLNQLADFALKPPDGDEALGAPAVTGAEDSTTSGDETLQAPLDDRPDDVEDDGVVDETGHDADDVADIATEGEDGGEEPDDDAADHALLGDHAADESAPALIDADKPALASEAATTRSVHDLLGDGSADLGELDGTDAVDAAAFEPEAADTAIDAEVSASAERASNGVPSTSPPASNASSTTLARPEDDAATLDDAAEPSGPSAPLSTHERR